MINGILGDDLAAASGGCSAHLKFPRTRLHGSMAAKLKTYNQILYAQAFWQLILAAQILLIYISRWDLLALFRTYLFIPTADHSHLDKDDF
jgi:hypothetical protein